MTQGRPSSEDLVLRPAPADSGLRPEGAHDPGPADGRPGTAPAVDRAPLLDRDRSDGLLQRWDDVQARFVDDPRGAVLDADVLVSDLVDALAQRFATHRRELEEQWSRGAEPSTEELRRALQQYRSFVQRLLAT